MSGELIVESGKWKFHRMSLRRVDDWEGGQMKSIVAEKSYSFAVRIVKLYRHLTAKKNEFVLSKQVLRSGTSAGANVREGQDAQSKADFVSKMSIALKECGETLYWLDLLHDTDYITVNQYRSLTDDCIELKKLLTSIVKTSRSRLSPHSPLSTLHSPLS